MKTQMFLGSLGIAVFLTANEVQAQPQWLDCSCLATQAVLTTNACQAVIPDLCQFTNCYSSSAVPPVPLTCSQSPPAGTPVGPGTHAITLTVMDSTGVAEQCALKFTVNPPATGGFALICAPNKTVECGTTWSFDPPTHTNACCPNPGTPGSGVTLSALSVVTNGTCPEVITITWQGVDDCGIAATCSQTVTVADTTPPVLSCFCLTNGNAVFPPLPLTVTNCSSVIPDFCQRLQQCATDNCGPLTCTQSPPAGTPVGPGVHPISVSVQDCAGNTASCQLNLSVVAPASGPFALICAPDKTVECRTPWTFDQPTPTNACCPHPGTPGNGIVLVSVTTVTNGTCPEVITRTWTARDDCGVVASCSQTVTVVDTTPPVLSCQCLQDPALVQLTVTGCSNVVPDLCLLLSTCATDACGPLTCSQSPPAGTVVFPGAHPITVTVTDCASNAVACTINFTVIAPPGGCQPCTFTTNDWNTGMAGGNALPTGTPDPNYLLVSAPPGGCTGPAQVLNPLSIPSPPWVANGPNSQWIGAGPTANCQEGVYHYRLCFYVPCTDGASIIGQWAVDDNGAIHLNGQPTGNTIPSQQYPNLPGYGWFPVSITNGFVCGTNCLDFYVTNASISVNPTGFRAELTNFFNDCCCPPVQKLGSVFSGADINGLLAPQAPDNQFALTCAPPGVSATVPVVIHPAFIPGVWVPNSATSQWIGPDPFNNPPAGVYCYTLNFNIPCPPGAPFKASLTGQWTADDWAALELNGQPTGHTVPSVQFPSNGFDVWHPINITNGFVSGANSLTFYVTNAGGPSGLRLELDLNSSCCDCTNIQCVVSIACPPDTNIVACSVVGGQTPVYYSPPSASSTCGGAVNVVCVPPSGGLFPIGATLVTCTATDAQGNTAACSFSVIVTAPPPWTVKCPPLQLSVTGCPPVLPDLCALVTITTNCPFQGGLTCTNYGPNGVMTNGTPLPPGQTVVVIRVCDSFGNCHDCDVIITAVYPDGCCAQPCATTPVLSLFSGATGAGVLPGGTFDPQFLTGAPLFSTPNPYVQSSVPGAWVANSAVSKWIGPMNNAWAGSPSGAFTYTNRFFLCSTNQAVVTGRWTADNTGVLRLNGVSKSLLPGTGYAFLGWTPVTITSGFVPGWNELTFVVTNWGGPTGLRTEITGSACCNDCVFITCPSDIVTNVCATGANVSWVPPLGVGSHCGTITSYSCTPPSGSFFPVGTNVVNCTAIDSCGNAGTCRFTVTVRPTAPPCVVKCPPNQTLYTCGTSATAFYKAKTSCVGAPLICTPPSGSVFPLGTNTVTCAVSTPCGIVSCSFKVIVKRYNIGPPWWDWPCLTPVLVNGLPKVAQSGSTLAVAPPLELPDFGPIGQNPALCLFPAPGSALGDVAIHTGNAQVFAFTTVLDMNAPDGATIEITDPTDPSGVPLLTLSKGCGPPRCNWDLKKCKGLVSDDLAFRVSAVNANGELLDSFDQTFNEGNTNAALALFAEDGVTEFPITILFDRRDGTISVTFPGDVQRPCCRPKGWDGTIKGRPPEAARKGWDGTIKGRPPEASMVTFTPVTPHAVTGEVMHIVTTGLSECPIIEDQIGVMGDQRTHDPVVIVKHYDKATPKLWEHVCQSTPDGLGVDWVSSADDTGVSLDLGRAASFDLGFAPALPPEVPGDGEYVEFRVGGGGLNPLALTNRPPPPAPIQSLRLEQNPIGVLCTVDFSYLAATAVTIQLWNNGALVGQGSTDGPVIPRESPLIIDRWPQRFGQLGVNGVLSLTGEFNVSGLQGDELRFIPTIPDDFELPEYLTALECVASEGLTGRLHDFQSTRACEPASLSISRASDGITLDWAGKGYRLQGAEKVDGPWIELGNTSPTTMPVGSPLRCFKLVCD